MCARACLVSRLKVCCPTFHPFFPFLADHIRTQRTPFPKSRLIMNVVVVSQRDEDSKGLIQGVGQEGYGLPHQRSRRNNNFRLACLGIFMPVIQPPLKSVQAISCILLHCVMVLRSVKTPGQGHTWHGTTLMQNGRVITF